MPRHPYYIIPDSDIYIYFRFYIFFLYLVSQIFLNIMRGCRTIRYSSHNLTKCLCTDISDGKYTRYICSCRFVCYDIARLIHIKNPFEQLRCRLSSDTNKCTIYRDFCIFACLYIMQFRSSKFFLI